MCIKVQVSRKPCFHTGPLVNNDSTTQETHRHWPQSDRPAVSQSLIHAQAFVTICCQLTIRFQAYTRSPLRAFGHTGSRRKTRWNGGRRASLQKTRLLKKVDQTGFTFLITHESNLDNTVIEHKSH